MANIYGDITKYSAVSDDDIVRIPTGIKTLDEYLKGGIPCGELTLLTSSEGAGKTTLTTQIAGFAADQGFKSMIYSGEMSGDSTLSIMLTQIAGPRWSSSDSYVDGIIRPSSDGRYVPDDTANYINEAVLAGKVNFFGSDIIRRWNQLKGAMEESYNDGCRLFIIDNLMTLTSLFGSDTANANYGTDQYYQQSGAIEYITDFAVHKKCAVILVCHTKKGGAALKDESNDGIYGTSAGKNLAGLILRFIAPTTYDRVKYNNALKTKECDAYAEDYGLDGTSDRVLMVTKNRLGGRILGANEAGTVIGHACLHGDIVLKYDPLVKRYYDYAMKYTGRKDSYISDGLFARRVSREGYDYAMLWEAGYIEYMAKAAGMTETPHLPVVDGAVKYYETKAKERQQRLDARNHPSADNRRLNGSELFADIFKK